MSRSSRVCVAHAARTPAQVIERRVEVPYEVVVPTHPFCLHRKPNPRGVGSIFLGQYPQPSDRAGLTQPPSLPVTIVYNLRLHRKFLISFCQFSPQSTLQHSLKRKIFSSALCRRFPPHITSQRRAPDRVEVPVPYEKVVERLVPHPYKQRKLWRHNPIL